MLSNRVSTLSRPFLRVHDWEEHKARLSHFWWLSLGGAPYRTDIYNVAAKHLDQTLGMTPALIEDWLNLFQATLRDQLPPEEAEAWLARARHMGHSLRMMLDFHANKPI